MGSWDRRAGTRVQRAALCHLRTSMSGTGDDEKPNGAPPATNGGTVPENGTAAAPVPAPAVGPAAAGPTGGPALSDAPAGSGPPPAGKTDGVNGHAGPAGGQDGVGATASGEAGGASGGGSSAQGSGPGADAKPVPKASPSAASLHGSFSEMSMVVGKKENGEDITALNLDGLSFDGDMFVAPSLIEEPNLEVRATPLPLPCAPHRTWPRPPPPHAAKPRTRTCSTRRKTLPLLRAAATRVRSTLSVTD